MSKRKFVGFNIDCQFNKTIEAMDGSLARCPEYVNINVDMIQWFGVNDDGDAIVKLNDGTVFFGADTAEIFKIEEAVYGAGGDVVI